MKKINKVKIKINGKKCIINPKMTLKEVIARFKIPLDKVAIELNENIIDKKELNKIKNHYPKIIKEVRGRGFLIGIQLHFDQAKFIKSLEKNYLLTIRAAENVIRILPPLNVKRNEIDLALRIIKKVCKEYN